jgi:hypothetical protein
MGTRARVASAGCVAAGAAHLSVVGETYEAGEVPS